MRSQTGTKKKEGKERYRETDLYWVPMDPGYNCVVLIYTNLRQAGDHHFGKIGRCVLYGTEKYFVVCVAKMLCFSDIVQQ